MPCAAGNPGVVVIQEWWGLVPHIRDVVDRFAAAGFSALAPDLYRGTTTTEPDPAGGPAKTVETKTARLQPGYLEAIYHLYSIALKQGPVVIRLRTANRTDAVTLPSLTPIWRSCDFQERPYWRDKMQ